MIKIFKCPTKTSNYLFVEITQQNNRKVATTASVKVKPTECLFLSIYSVNVYLNCARIFV